MKKDFIIKSLNLAGASVLVLEKAKDRLEFEALAVYLLGHVTENPNGLDKSCWPNFPSPCKQLIPEPGQPECVKWYNPPCDHTSPQPTPQPCNNNPTPQPCNNNPAPPPCDNTPTPPTPPVNPNPGGGGGGE